MSNTATASLRGKAQASARSANPHLRIYRHCKRSEAIHNLQNLEMLRDNTESSSIIPPPLAEGVRGWAKSLRANTRHKTPNVLHNDNPTNKG